MKVRFEDQNASFDDISPITGNQSVLTEPDSGTLWSICMDSGYFTRDSFENSDFLEEYETTLPEIVQLHKIIDQFGRPWFPSVLSVSSETAVWTLFPIHGSDDTLWYELQKTPIVDGTINYGSSVLVESVPMLEFSNIFNALYNPETTC